VARATIAIELFNFVIGPSYPTRHCERSEAIQCCAAVLDCFVASLLAMTV
jgi:hypothetical protein